MTAVVFVVIASVGWAMFDEGDATLAEAWAVTGVVGVACALYELGRIARGVSDG